MMSLTRDAFAAHAPAAHAVHAAHAAHASQSLDTIFSHLSALDLSLPVHRALNGLLSFLLFGVTLSHTSAAGAVLVGLSSVAYISWPSIAPSLGPSFSDAGPEGGAGGAGDVPDHGGGGSSPGAGRGAYAPLRTAVLPAAAAPEDETEE